MAVVIKTFKTPSGNYVYDRETNSLLSVSEEEFVACRKIEVGKASEDDWALLQRYKNQGYLQESCLKTINHPATQYLPFQTSGSITQLTLQCTQFCNLRCKYCAYSGSYEGQRTHTQSVMSLNTMKQAIDFLMSHSMQVREVTVGFYGGEPMLELELIKNCVDYIQTKYKGKSVNYTMTTNGTILNDEIINFLIDSNFNLNISLDGPKELHDKNRTFMDDSGSFDIIMNNVKHIKNKYPEFFKKISFLTVVAPKVDLSCVNNFYDADEILNDSTVMQNTVTSYGYNENLQYDNLYNITNNYHHMKAILAELGVYDKSKVSKMFATRLSDVNDLHGMLSKVKMLEIMHPGGPCLPGVMRPFVAVDGSIYPCERVNESLSMAVGHVNTGLDLQKIEAILNVGKLTIDECKACWNFIHCKLCVAACDNGDGLCKNTKLSNCMMSEVATLDALKTICLLLEQGYDFESQTTANRTG
ncbi:MAG: Cys-rich peptide radical SAM maturase CcpM [Defluviitaleaceae bacterium]|nr:Cys-rich peptide radical SAM maturase CcpM [Defluviitaleaceae bacterium]MCL2275121.1 Cys-rich peptide radical SAM maturase CcpM [Defluviitaleaceae bacterium]